jgi:hypothetical protein
MGHIRYGHADVGCGVSRVSLACTHLLLGHLPPLLLHSLHLLDRLGLTVEHVALALLHLAELALLDFEGLLLPLLHRMLPLRHDCLVPLPHVRLALGGELLLLLDALLDAARVDTRVEGKVPRSAAARAQNTASWHGIVRSSHIIRTGRFTQVGRGH